MYSSKSAICSPGGSLVSRRALDELERRRRDLVRVDLVAEQQQRVGPLRLAALEQLSSTPRARRRPARTSSSCQGASSESGWGPPTRHEPKTSRTRRSSFRVWTTGARTPVVGRPDELAVEPDLVRRHRGRLEVVDEEQRVVVPLDGERPRAVAEDLDLARRARLDPEGRALRAGVAQQRAEDERHRGILMAATTGGTQIVTAFGSTLHLERSHLLAVAAVELVAAPCGRA